MPLNLSLRCRSWWILHLTRANDAPYGVSISWSVVWDGEKFCWCEINRILQTWPQIFTIYVVCIKRSSWSTAPHLFFSFWWNAEPSCRIFIISEHPVKTCSHLFFGIFFSKRGHSYQTTIQEYFSSRRILLRFKVQNFALISQSPQQEDHIYVNVLQNDAWPAVTICMRQLLNRKSILVRLSNGQPAVRIHKVRIKFVIICCWTSSKTPIFHRWKSICGQMMLWILRTSWFLRRIFNSRILLDCFCGRMWTLRSV